MEFEYFQQVTVLASLNVEDIGNCAIEANTDIGQTFYLVIKTYLGTSMIFQYGPICLDLNLLEKTTNCNFSRIEFKESALKKIIAGFLNQKYYSITQAKVIDAEEAYNNCINIIEYMKTQEF